MKPLGVIPVYISDEKSFDLTTKTLLSTQLTADIDVICVDDHSPRQDLVDQLEQESAVIDVEWFRKKENTGFSKTVNVGLNQALSEGRDAVLINADIEFFEEGWLSALQAPDAYVTGGLLLFPNGTIQHAGIYFSVLNRYFDHIYRYGPANLPEAQRERVCPVTGALQYIKHEALAIIGLYDEDFKMGYEDIDYCLRVFDAGKNCVYTPAARAIHYEKMFRGDFTNDKLKSWHDQSFQHLFTKHAGKSFADYMPTMLIGGEGWTNELA